MNLWQALILGIVEGITEFLPVSSTGHLILTGYLLKIPQTDFMKSFDIIIQLGAILAVVALYGKSLLLDVRILKRVFLAFLPTAVIGLLAYPFVKHHLLGNHLVVVGSLFFGGIFIILFEKFYHENKAGTEELGNLSYQKALLIGIFQSIAMIPGVSRSAATILGGLMLGLKRRTIVEFSFLLAVPTMLAATGLEFVKNVNTFSMDQFAFLSCGFIVSFIMAIISIKFLLHFIVHHDFVPFGIYRIIIALIFIGGFM